MWSGALLISGISSRDRIDLKAQVAERQSVPPIAASKAADAPM